MSKKKWKKEAASVIKDHFGFLECLDDLSRRDMAVILCGIYRSTEKKLQSRITKLLTGIPEV